MKHSSYRLTCRSLQPAFCLLAAIFVSACHDVRGVTAPTEADRTGPPVAAPGNGPSLNVLTDPIATGTGVSINFDLADCSGTSCSETVSLGNPTWGVNLDFKDEAVRQAGNGNLYRMVFSEWEGARSNPLKTWSSDNNDPTFLYCHPTQTGCTVYGPQWVRAEWTIAQVPALATNLAGPTSITLKGYYSWNAQVTNAEKDETFTYLWQRSLDGATWTTHSTASGFQQNFQTGDPSFYLRLTVTSSYGRTSTSTVYVNVASNLEPPVTVVISGPASVRPNDECTWTGSASGGTSPYTYEWYGAQVDFDSWDGNTYTATTTSPRTVIIRLDVTDGSNQVGWASREVTVSNSAPPC